eukprot:COSAG04_NODE_10263_length_791_cov_1.140173_2_plen_61_part_01
MAMYRAMLLLVSCALSVGSQQGAPLLPHHLRPGPGRGLETQHAASLRFTEAPEARRRRHWT